MGCALGQLRYISSFVTDLIWRDVLSQDSYCWDFYGDSSSYIPGDEWLLPDYPGTDLSCEDQAWAMDPAAYCATNPCEGTATEGYDTSTIPSCFNVKAGTPCACALPSPL